MDWARILAYVTGTVDQELLARNEYLAAENRILKAQLDGRLRLSDAYAERWVRSVKDECLSKVILFGERSLRRALSEYVEHYHAERNHQGKGNVLLFPRNPDVHREGAVQCRERLGGLLHYYHSEAARSHAQCSIATLTLSLRSEIAESPGIRKILAPRAPTLGGSVSLRTSYQL